MILDVPLQNIENSVSKKRYGIEYTPSKKFVEDNIYSDLDDYLLLLDGVVLNKKELMANSSVDNWRDFLINSYKQVGEDFFIEMKGSYFGVLCDKKADRWIIFNDHIGSKYLYHSEYNNHLVFSDSYVELSKYLVKNKIELSLNEQGAELILSYGFTFEDRTISNEIKRMLIGHCAIIECNKLLFRKFFQFSNKPIEIAEDEAIEILDEKFREAIKLAFDKDIEYGYKHLSSMSGGLDSRMVSWVANDMGYRDQLNITFAQNGSPDEKIAKKISSDLKHDWLFKALDNGNCLKNIDDITALTGGNVVSYGLSVQMSIYNHMDFGKRGILHTGQLGDVVISSYSNGKVQIPYSKSDGAYSSVLIDELSNIEFKGEYPNQEMFMMYIRGLYGMNQGLAPVQNFTEAYSPFYDIDFMSFALSIPLELRANHYLYKKWILKKYPLAAKYPWDKINTKIDNRFKFNLGKSDIYVKNLPKMIINKISGRKGFDSIKSMNPFGHWYNHNEDLRNIINDYYNANISLVTNEKIKKHCVTLFNNYSVLEKIQVVSLLSAVKLSAEIQDR